MGRAEELEKADRAIKDLYMRAQTIKLSFDAIEREVDKLSTIETQLEENLKYLKKKKIIALAFEYKKVKDDLGKVQRQLILVKNDREAARKAFNETNKTLEGAKEHYQKVLRGNENNVLRGNFGRKRG